MPFEKGKPKTGGKKKGTPNKTTHEIKESFKLLIEKNLDNISDWLDRVAETDPSKALTHIEQLSEYIIPKLARSTTEITGDVNHNVQLPALTTAELLQRANAVKQIEVNDAFSRNTN